MSDSRDGAPAPLDTAATLQGGKRRNRENRFSGAALDAPSDPETGDSACLHEVIKGACALAASPGRSRRRGCGV